MDKTAFKNLGSSVETVALDNNLLATMREEVFVTLTNLKSLSLHSNPWVCDCRYGEYGRDQVIQFEYVQGDMTFLSVKTSP